MKKSDDLAANQQSVQSVAVSRTQSFSGTGFARRAGLGASSCQANPSFFAAPDCQLDEGRISCNDFICL